MQEEAPAGGACRYPLLMEIKTENPVIIPNTTTRIGKALSRADMGTGSEGDTVGVGTGDVAVGVSVVGVGITQLQRETQKAKSSSPSLDDMYA
ncbi:hypothetical protein HC928_06215 [bacterium]|nr:hypothetical protein [bacterium]